MALLPKLAKDAEHIMKQVLRDAYIARIVTELGEAIAGSNFERCGYIISDHYFSDYEMMHKGTTVSGSPVGHIVDSVSYDAKVVAEYSTESNYFESVKKIKKDTRHSFEHYAASLMELLLISNRECPPKMQTLLNRRASRIFRLTGKKVVVWDSRKVAEYIVDEMLFDESMTERMSHFLPSLVQIRNESILNLSLPKIDRKYIRREDVENIIGKKVSSGMSVVVTGLGGIGKSSIASAVARNVKDDFDLVIWIDASDLNRLEDLKAFDIHRNSHSVNLSGVLKGRKCLLVLDNLAVSCSSLELEDICDSGSAIIATRKETRFSSDFELPSLSRDVAKSILDFELSVESPSEVFEKVYGLVGGYPLIYGLMNANLMDGDYTWDDIAMDCEAISEYSDDRNKKLAERLLGHLGASLDKELSFLKACGSKQIDASFARYVLKPIGLKKLKQSAVLTHSSQNLLKVHDIVYEVVVESEIKAMYISPLLSDFLSDLTATDWAGFLRVACRHDSLIKKLYDECNNAVFLYAHIIAGNAHNIDSSAIPMPELQLDFLVNNQSDGEFDLKLSLLLESIEVLYRVTKSVPVESDVSTEKARSDLESRLPIYISLLGLENLKDSVRDMVKNHYGKSLLWVKKDETVQAAQVIFTELSLQDLPVREAQLQLARLYLQKGSNGEDAKKIIESILESWSAVENKASISVVLAAFELITRSAMNPYKNELNDRYADTVAGILKEAMAYGYDQAYRAFSVFSQSWSYHRPEQFIEVFQCLPIPTIEQLKDDYAKKSIANLLRETGKVYERYDTSKAKPYFHMALEFYSALERSGLFDQRRIAETLCRAESYLEAQELCNKILGEQSDDPFTNFWLAKSRVGLGNSADALIDIDTALEQLQAKDAHFRSSFLEVKSDILKLVGEPGWIVVLQEAYDLCNDKKYKNDLELKLRAAA